VPHVRGTRINDDARIDSRSVLWDFLSQTVDEDVLSNGDSDGAAQRIEEHDQGIRSRHVLFASHNLDCNEGDLNACAGAQAREDLVTDPVTGRGVEFKRIQHSRTDGEDGTAEPHEGGIVAKNGNQAADYNGREGDTAEVGNGANP